MPKIKLTSAIVHPESKDGIAKAGDILDLSIADAASLVQRGRAELVKGETLAGEPEVEAEAEKPAAPKRKK